MPVGKSIGGVATGTLVIGEVLTLRAEPGAQGRVVVFPTDTVGPAFDARDVQDGGTASFGPFTQPRYVRVFTPVGNVRVETSFIVPAVTPLEPAVISDDRRTISGQGAVPDSRVQVFDQDSGIGIGSPLANMVGEWSLTLAAPLPEDTRVGYAITVFGPTSTVQVTLGLLDFSRADNGVLILVL